MGRLMVLSEAPLARVARRSPSPVSALLIAASWIAVGTTSQVLPLEDLAQLAIGLAAYLAGFVFSVVAIVRVSRG